MMATTDKIVNYAPLDNRAPEQIQEEDALRKRITISALKSAFALLTIILAAVKLIFPILAYFCMAVSGYTGAQTGFLFLSYSITEAIGALIIAPLGDKFGMDKLLLIMYPGIIIGYGICAFFPQDYWIFMVGFSLAGFFSDGYGLANAYVSIIALNKQDNARYCGYLESAFGVCSAIGPIMSTGLYGLDMSAPFFTSVGISVLCAIFIFFSFYGDQNKLVTAKKEYNDKYDDNKTFERASITQDDQDDVENGPKLKKSTITLLGFLCLIEFFKAAGFSSYGAFMIMYMDDETNDGIVMASIQLAIGQAFIIFGSMSSNYFLQTKGYKPRMLLIILMIYMVGVIFVIISFVKKYDWIMYIMSPQIGYAIGLFNVCVSISISEITPSQKIGLVSGVRLFLLDLGFGAGPLLCSNYYEANPDNIWYIQIGAYAGAFVCALIFYIFKSGAM